MKSILKKIEDRLHKVISFNVFKHCHIEECGSFARSNHTSVEISNVFVHNITNETISGAILLKSVIIGHFTMSTTKNIQ